MKTVLFLLFLLSSFSAIGQIKYNYSRIDEHARFVPLVETSSIPRLSAYLTKPAANEVERVRALHTWITHNIRYDETIEVNSPWSAPEEMKLQHAETVLQNRKGVCLGYAQLFAAMAQAAGLQTAVVSGMVKEPDGYIPRIGHAWIAVQIDKKWFLCDPTWDAQSVLRKNNRNKKEYFLLKPAEFIYNHLPFDPMWQLLENPFDVTTFSRSTEQDIQRLLADKPLQPFQYQDTIATWYQQDTLTQMLTASDRMLRFNPDNEYVLTDIGRAHRYRYLALYIQADSLLQMTLQNKQPLMDSSDLHQRLEAMAFHFKMSNQFFERVRNRDKALEEMYKSLETADNLEGIFLYFKGIHQLGLLLQLTERDHQPFVDKVNRIERHAFLADSLLLVAWTKLSTVEEKARKVHQLNIAHQRESASSITATSYVVSLSSNPEPLNHIFEKQQLFLMQIEKGRQHVLAAKQKHANVLALEKPPVDSIAYYYEEQLCMLALFEYYIQNIRLGLELNKLQIEGDAAIKGLKNLEPKLLTLTLGVQAAGDTLQQKSIGIKSENTSNILTFLYDNLRIAHFRLGVVNILVADIEVRNIKKKTAFKAQKEGILARLDQGLAATKKSQEYLDALRKVSAGDVSELQTDIDKLTEELSKFKRKIAPL